MFKMKTILLLLIYKVRYFVLSIVNFLVPKEKNQIFVSDKFFKKDNAWYFINYLLKNEKKYKIYYYTKCTMEKNEKINFIKNPYLALWKQLRSKVIVYSYRSDGVIFFKSAHGQKIIDTMHGSPLKQIGYPMHKYPYKKLRSYEKTFDYILCNSPAFKGIIKDSFGASEKQSLISGYPRNDELKNRNFDFSKIDIDEAKFKKILLWVPTWRSSKKNNIYINEKDQFPILNEENIDEFNIFLKENNYLLIIKPHPFQYKIDLFNQQKSNILIVTNNYLLEKNTDLYEFLGSIDILITDYSSIYFDYLLTLRPIIFTIDDMDKWSANQGYSFKSPTEMMPGDKIKTIVELKKAIIRNDENPDKYLIKRKKINNIVNKYTDFNSNDRILKTLDL